MFLLDTSHEENPSLEFFTTPDSPHRRKYNKSYAILGWARAAAHCVFEAIESMGLGPPSMLLSHPPATPGCQAWNSFGPHRTREFDRSINNMTAHQFPPHEDHSQSVSILLCSIQEVASSRRQPKLNRPILGTSRRDLASLSHFVEHPACLDRWVS